MKKTRIFFSTVFISALLIIIGIAASPVCSYAAEGDIDSGTYDGVPWRITEDYVLQIGEDGAEYTFTYRGSRERDSDSGDAYPWHDYAASIKEVKILGTVHGNGSHEEMFTQFTACTSMELSGFETSTITNMQWMFSTCTNLQTLDLNGFNTSGTTIMHGMFNHCHKLQTINLSSFDTSGVTDMAYMFYECNSLQTLDLSGFNTSSVTNMSQMFTACRSLTTLDVSALDTSKVTKMDQMFGFCTGLQTLDLSGLDTSSVTDMSCMFQSSYNLQTVNLSGLDTSSATDMSQMFDGCKNLTSLNLSSLDTDNVSSMYGMFKSCNSLQSLDLEGFDTSNVTEMRQMFYGCTSLTSLDLSGLDFSKVTNMDYVFGWCSSLTSLDLSGLDFSSVTTMDHAFGWCSSLTSLDLSGLDFSSVTNMEYLFRECNSLTSLDLSGLDFSSVTTMNHMLYRCTALRTLITPNWSSRESAATFPAFPLRMKNAVTGEEYEANATIPAVDNATFEACEIIIDGSEESTVSKEQFEEIAGTDMSLVIQDTDIQWTFNGQDIDPNKCKEIDITTNIHKEAGKNVGFANDDEVLVIDFADNGTLPGKAEVKVINDYIAAQIGSGADHLMLSYVDGDGIILEDSNVSLEGEDAAVFKITHNSRFVLSKKRAAISLSGAKVVVGNRVYTGKAQKPSIKVVLKGRTLSSKYYKISGWANNKKVGTATVAIKGNTKYGYTGTAKGHFYINPKKAVISSVKAGKKKIVVTMKTKASSTGGSYYKIQYRVAGSGSWKSTTTTGKTKTISKLKKGKKYQVKVTAIKGSRKGAASKIKTSGKVK